MGTSPTKNYLLKLPIKNYSSLIYFSQIHKCLIAILSLSFRPLL